jgi:hypothetical protein
MVQPLTLAEKLSAAELAHRPLLCFLRKRLVSWLVRHRHPFNFALHLIGIPLAVTGVVLFFFVSWYWALGALFLGYLLQYCGHQVEGNDVGEWAGIKRLLGLPYVGVSPRWEQPRQISEVEAGQPAL